MKLLITNIALASRSGTEVVAAELALELRRRGHEVVIYSTQCGELAEVLRGQGLAVVDRISKVPFTPDFIHGNHNVCLATAITRFPEVPTLLTCHDYDVFHDQPFTHPTIHRHIPVDLLCKRRLHEHQIPDSKIQLIHNKVNLEAYQLRELPAAAPGKALILAKGAAHEAVVSKVCHDEGIDLDMLGPAFNNSVDNLHEVLPKYDLVFATARMALEAAACGCGVVVVDHRGLAGYLTSSNWKDWYDWNLGRGILSHLVTEKGIREAVAAWDPLDLRQLTPLVRNSCSLASGVDELESLYDMIISEAGGLAKDPKIDQGNPDMATFLEDYLPSYNNLLPGYSAFQHLTGNKVSPELTAVNELRESLEQRMLSLEGQLEIKVSPELTAVNELRESLEQRMLSLEEQLKIKVPPELTAVNELRESLEQRMLSLEEQLKILSDRKRFRWF